MVQTGTRYINHLNETSAKSGWWKMSAEDRVLKRSRGEATAQGLLRIFTALCERKRSCVHLLH